MNDDFDLDRRIRAFLDEGPTRLSDRVYDAVAVTTHRTRQRATLGPWRFPRMSALSKLATMTLVAVILGIFGLAVLPQAGDEDAPGAAPGPSPQPSPTISTADYAWPRFLEAGTYETDFAFDLPVLVTFTVPDGWQGRDVNLTKDDRISLMTMAVDNLFSDPCSGVLQDPPIGVAPDDLVEALVAMPGLTSTTPQPSSLGGRQGTYLEWELSPDADCSPFDARIFRLGPLVCDAGCGSVGGQDVGVEFATDGVQHRTWVLDAGDGVRLVIDAISRPDATPEDLAELQAVVDSIAIADKPPATPSPSPTPS